MDRNLRLHAASSPRRPRHRSAALLLGSGLLAIVAGCTQPGPYLRRQTMMGSLKSNVAQLESEKDVLAKQVAELRSENRRIENDLAAVEEKRDELATRLDDARNLISRQGLDGDGLGSSSRSASDSERTSPRRATPARSQPKGRKAPFAQIPNERRLLDDPDESAANEEVELPPPRTRRGRSDDQSRLDDRSPWLPVARGGPERPRPVR